MRRDKVVSGCKTWQYMIRVRYSEDDQVEEHASPTNSIMLRAITIPKLREVEILAYSVIWMWGVDVDVCECD